MRVGVGLIGVAVIALATQPGLGADAKQKPPYFASISAGRARMRTGPARTYPASWIYQRADLPVRVVAVLKGWRKVEDPDGTQGWMQGNMISQARTAIVHGGEPLAMREQPSPGARLLWRAAPGVVGRVSQCDAGWCRFDVKGQAGYVETGGLWGVDPMEKLP